MNWASYLLSLCLHLAVFLLIMFWPSSPPVNLETPPVMISLVDGAPGGNRTPSSILGKMGKPTDGPKDVSPPAKKADAAAPERPEVKADPTADKARPVEAKPEPKVERKPEPKHEVKPKPEPKDATPVADKKDKKKKRKCKLNLHQYQMHQCLLMQIFLLNRFLQFYTDTVNIGHIFPRDRREKMRRIVKLIPADLARDRLYFTLFFTHSYFFFHRLK